MLCFVGSTCVGCCCVGALGMCPSHAHHSPPLLALPPFAHARLGIKNLTLFSSEKALARLPLPTNSVRCIKAGIVVRSPERRGLSWTWLWPHLFRNSPYTTAFSSQSLLPFFFSLPVQPGKHIARLLISFSKGEARKKKVETQQ